MESGWWSCKAFGDAYMRLHGRIVGYFWRSNYARRLGLRAVVELHVDSRDSSGGEGVHSRSLWSPIDWLRECLFRKFIALLNRIRRWWSSIPIMKLIVVLWITWFSICWQSIFIHETRDLLWYAYKPYHFANSYNNMFLLLSKRLRYYHQQTCDSY
jgi:hypothetical protein